MSNLRDPSDPLNDTAFAALVRFVEGEPVRNFEPIVVGQSISREPGIHCQVTYGPRPVPRLVSSNEPTSEVSRWALEALAKKAMRAADDLLTGVAPLRALGLNDDELLVISRYADVRGMPVRDVAADWLRCVMDTIETVG